MTKRDWVVRRAVSDRKMWAEMKTEPDGIFADVSGLHLHLR